MLTGAPKPITPSPNPRSRHSLHFVRDFVDVDAAVVGFLLVITIPALREGECGGKGVTEGSPMGLEGGAGFSPEGMTRG